MHDVPTWMVSLSASCSLGITIEAAPLPAPDNAWEAKDTLLAHSDQATPVCDRVERFRSEVCQALSPVLA